jgi:cobalamin biosynthesis Mg chelatase CobN
MKTICLLSFICVATLFVGSDARADVPPPETEPCLNKTAGAACVYGDGGTGTCQEQTCSKIDYLGWDRDASSSPPTASYACLKCITGTTSNTVTSTQSTTRTATVGPSDTATNTATAGPTVTATNTATAGPSDTGTDTGTPGPSTAATGTQTGTDTSSSGDSGWCSVGKGSTMGRFVPWLLAAAFSLLFLLGRRRK